jgi:hypothetical protein
LTRPRISIAGMMGLVAVVALEVLGGRILFGWDPYILAAVGPSALLLQVCLFRVVRDRWMKRAFWVGCALGLAVAAGLCLWGMAGGLRHRPQFDPVLGKNVAVSVAGDPMWPEWPDYRAAAYRFIISFPNGSDLMNRFDLISMAVYGLVMLLPQLGVAVVCGLLALIVAGTFGLIARWKPSRAISRRRIPRPNTTKSTPA